MTSLGKLIDKNVYDFEKECLDLIIKLFEDGIASNVSRTASAKIMIDSIKNFIPMLEYTHASYKNRFNDKCVVDKAIDSESSYSSSGSETSPPKKIIGLLPHEEFKEKAENIMEFFNSTQKKMIFSGDFKYKKRLLCNLNYLQVMMRSLIPTIEEKLKKEEENSKNQLMK